MPNGALPCTPVWVSQRGAHLLPHVTRSVTQAKMVTCPGVGTTTRKSLTGVCTKDPSAIPDKVVKKARPVCQEASGGAGLPRQSGLKDRPRRRGTFKPLPVGPVTAPTALGTASYYGVLESDEEDIYPSTHENAERHTTGTEGVNFRSPDGGDGRGKVVAEPDDVGRVQWGCSHDAQFPSVPQLNTIEVLPFSGRPLTPDVVDPVIAVRPEIASGIARDGVSLTPWTCPIPDDDDGASVEASNAGCLTLWLGPALDCDGESSVVVMDDGVIPPWYCPVPDDDDLDVLDHRVIEDGERATPSPANLRHIVPVGDSESEPSILSGDAGSPHCHLEMIGQAYPGADDVGVVAHGLTTGSPPHPGPSEWVALAPSPGVGPRLQPKRKAKVITQVVRKAREGKKARGVGFSPIQARKWGVAADEWVDRSPDRVEEGETPYVPMVFPTGYTTKKFRPPRTIIKEGASNTGGRHAWRIAPIEVEGQAVGRADDTLVSSVCANGSGQSSPGVVSEGRWSLYHRSDLLPTQVVLSRVVSQEELSRHSDRIAGLGLCGYLSLEWASRVEGDPTAEGLDLHDVAARNQLSEFLSSLLAGCRTEVVQDKFRRVQTHLATSITPWTSARADGLWLDGQDLIDLRVTFPLVVWGQDQGGGRRRILYPFNRAEGISGPEACAITRVVPQLVFDCAHYHPLDPPEEDGLKWVASTVRVKGPPDVVTTQPDGGGGGRRAVLQHGSDLGIHHADQGGAGLQKGPAKSTTPASFEQAEGDLETLERPGRLKRVRQDEAVPEEAGMRKRRMRAVESTSGGVDRGYDGEDLRPAWMETPEAEPPD